MLRTNVYQNNIFVIRQLSPALCEKTGPVHLRLVGLMADRKAVRLADKNLVVQGFFNSITRLLMHIYWFSIDFKL